MDHATPARFLAAHEATATAPISLLLRQPLPPRDQCAARLRISVIIPAKDEAATLPATQTTEHGQPLPPAASRSSYWPIIAGMLLLPWCAVRALAR
ncbi:hypothetical protein [Hymenobacter siberiensis]|uniref:hypothetical protein n=1 Tax=Hymenobacter siberiensis TaxID=2848396 RepID=UPI001C1E3938|nr:hypothetical protein [Hymenobacter siberiensis]MBU6123193.1 hypothetical protein [Hymenobacter siberiensis]